MAHLYGRHYHRSPIHIVAMLLLAALVLVLTLSVRDHKPLQPRYRATPAGGIAPASP